MSVNSILISALSEIVPAQPTVTELVTANGGRLPSEYASFVINACPRAF